MTASRVHITELRTARLTLRVPHPSDFPAFAAFQTSARAVLSFAFDTLGHGSVPAYVGKTNARSRSLAQRLGAVADGEWTAQSGDIEDIWRIRRPA